MFHKINGSAGYGKTYNLIEKAVSLYDPELKQQSFILITPTNKAAMVLNVRLQAAGLPKLAKTLHSTLYKWVCTDKVLRITQERVMDPTTLKFKVDSDGNPVYTSVTEYKYEKTIRPELEDLIVLVDESSMVTSDVWYDLIESDLFTEIYSYGDEKQLPPIEQYEKLDAKYRPYYRFWYNYQATDTLSINYRQHGSLKDFVEACEDSIFNHGARSGIPTPLWVGDNFSIHSNFLQESDLLAEMMDSDIIITPFKKVRYMINVICRKELAKRNKKRYVDVPVKGDKIILTETIKRVDDDGNKTVYLAKNVCGIVDKVHDIDLDDDLIIMDFTDETGLQHKNEILSLAKIFDKNVTTTYAKFDYAYGVTAHSAQGGQWPKVLFFDSHFPSDLDKLRYVSITRASKRIRIILGITNKTESSDADKSILVRIHNNYKGL